MSRPTSFWDSLYLGLTTTLVGMQAINVTAQAAQAGVSASFELLNIIDVQDNEIRERHTRNRMGGKGGEWWRCLMSHLKYNNYLQVFCYIKLN